MLDKREIVNKTISILYDGKGLNKYDRSSVMELRDQASLAIDLQAEVDQLKSERRWISINERLPTFDDSWQNKVLVHFKNGVIDTWNPILIEQHLKMHTSELKVTHWMPLPQPPEGSEKHEQVR